MINDTNDTSSIANLFEVSGNSPPTAVNSAKDYARRGWPVFPIYEMRDGACSCGNTKCGSPGKHPRTSTGFKEATGDLGQIDSWWHQWPNANVGIRTGGAIVVIDVDPRNGGDKALQTLQAAHGALPVTVTANTGGGGEHYFFTDPGVPLKVKLDTGIDVKREGGYVVAAPSNHHTGGVYSWQPGRAPGEVELAPLPDWIVRILTAPAPMPSSGASGDAIPDGKRNSTLTSMAGTMRRAGFDEDEIYAAISKVNLSRCNPPLDDHAVAGISRSVGRYEPATSAKSAMRKLVFKTAAEIAASASLTPEWIVWPLAVKGAITELTGSPKLGGKSTLLLAGVKAVTEGDTFLGKPTMKSAVVYLTEESDATFTFALGRAGLTASTDVHVLSWLETSGVSWDNIVRQAAERCVEVGANLLVVDTLGQFCGLKGDSENESGTALEILRPLKEAASRAKVAIIVVRHDRKSGGEVGQAGRGSTAFSGAVDQLIRLRRPEGNSRDSLRVMTCSGRAQMPDELVVDRLADGTYAALGNSTEVALDEARSAVVMNLPEEADAAITLDDLIGRIGTASRTTVQRVLDEFRSQCRVHRVGEGKKGDPYRFWFSGRHDA